MKICDNNWKIGAYVRCFPLEKDLFPVTLFSLALGMLFSIMIANGTSKKKPNKKTRKKSPQNPNQLEKKKKKDYWHSFKDV